MKTKNSIKKLVVAGMASAMIAAAVGSISGTVAWFQYNTRATAAYHGATAKCTENLQVRIYDSSLIKTDIETQRPYADAAAWDAAFPWGSELSTSMIDNYLKVARGAWDSSLQTPAWANSNDTKLYPVTSGALAADAVPSKFYKSPEKARVENGAVIGEKYESWNEADEHYYVDLPLQFRLLDVDGESDVTDGRNYIAKELFITDLDVSAKSGSEDITSALRVAFNDGTVKKTLSKGGETVNVYGNLDLDQDGNLDKVYVNGSTPVKWDYQASQTTPGTPDTRTVVYGGTKNDGTAQTPQAVSTKIETGTGKPIADATGDKKYAPEGDKIGDLLAGHTSTADDAWYTLNIRIYLEGWAKLDGYGTTTSPASDATIWNDIKYVGAEFYVGMEFAVAAIK